ncbi:recombination regulator RecX [Pseudonocardia dioxanivorans]|uniref:recombination regulator RecX n=2 Tax=Pseudonocardia dioxanivorans TaxID=240495 RepID=UPI0031332FEE
MIALASLDLDRDVDSTDSPAEDSTAGVPVQVAELGPDRSDDAATPRHVRQVGLDLTDGPSIGADDEPRGRSTAGEPAVGSGNNSGSHSGGDSAGDEPAPAVTIASLSDLPGPASAGGAGPVVRRAADLLGPAPRTADRRRTRRTDPSSGGARRAGRSTEPHDALPGAPADSMEAGRTGTRSRPDRPRRATRGSSSGEPSADDARTFDDACTFDAAGARLDRGTSRRGRGDAASRRRSRTDQPPEPPADPVAAARTICLRLLESRSRTRQELAQALRRKGIPDDAADVVLERFGEVGLIDDKAFADQWVRSRHTYRGLGRRAIAVELRRKGVDSETAGEALAEVDDASEEARARALVDRKLRTRPGLPDESTARRLLGMLARKGYPAGIAYRVVREAVAEHAAELAEQIPTDDS